MNAPETRGQKKLVWHVVEAAAAAVLLFISASFLEEKTFFLFWFGLVLLLNIFSLIKAARTGILPWYLRYLEMRGGRKYAFIQSWVGVILVMIWYILFAFGLLHK